MKRLVGSLGARRLSTHGHSALFDYIRAGDARGAKRFLERMSFHGKNAIKLAINSRDGSNFTPSMACVAEVSQAKTEKLPKSARKNDRARGRKEILKMLIAEGADMNAADDWGRGVAHLAAMNNDYEAILVLAESNPSSLKDQLDSDGFSAADYSHDDDLDSLLRAGGGNEQKGVLMDKLRSRFNPPLSKIHSATTLSELQIEGEEELDRQTPSAAAEQNIESLADDLSVEMTEAMTHRPIKGLELGEMAKKQLRNINQYFEGDEGKKADGLLQDRPLEEDDRENIISADGLFQDRPLEDEEILEEEEHPYTLRDPWDVRQD